MNHFRAIIVPVCHIASITLVDHPHNTLSSGESIHIFYKTRVYMELSWCNYHEMKFFVHNFMETTRDSSFLLVIWYNSKIIYMRLLKTETVIYIFSFAYAHGLIKENNFLKVRCLVLIVFVKPKLCMCISQTLPKLCCVWY
jgi:hypothetical protein